MKNIVLKLFVLLISVFALQSCLLDDTVKDFGQGPIVTQFPSASATGNFLQDGSGKVYDYKVPIQYFGTDNTPLSQDVTVTVAVAADSQAKEGVHVTIPNKTVIIPAGSNVGELLIKVNSDVLEASNPPILKLQIVESSQKVSSNKNITNIKLQAVCPSNLAGNYNYVRADGTVIKAATIKSTGVGTYEVSGDAAFRTNYPFNFSDVCGKITVTGGYLNDNFGIPVSGSGSVDKATGKITITYTAEGYFENRVMTLVKQ